MGNIQRLFHTIDEDHVDNPGALVKFAEVLERYLEKPDFQDWFGQYSGDLIIDKE